MDKKIFTIIRWEDDGDCPEVSAISSHESQEEAKKAIQELIDDEDDDVREDGEFEDDNTWVYSSLEKGTFLRFKIEENFLHSN